MKHITAASYAKRIFVLVTSLLFSASFASALTISPARLEMSGDPGQTLQGEFLLINEQENTQVFYTSAENFEAQGETGTPNFVEGKDGLASWISLRKEITLSKGEQVKVPFTITIPRDADAGGHFAAIFLSTIPPSTGKAGEVAVGAKVGMLILLKTSGEVKEGGGILDFITKTKQSFFTTLPITFVYRFNNSGNDRVNPSGNISITNMFGFKTVTLSANPSLGNVLPESTRRFEVNWGEESTPYSNFFETVQYQAAHFAFGYYTANLSISYGTNGSASSSLSFFVLPWQLLLVLLVGLLILGFVFSRLIRKYNQWIISQAHHKANK